MPIVLHVERQRFEFGSDWMMAFKYDDTVYYRRYLERLKGVVAGVYQSTRAVDVVGRHRSEGLLLLEAKDFRGHRLANQKRITSGELSTEIALKVRDTVAGLVGANRKAQVAFSELSELSKDFTVVLWIEDDVQNNAAKARQQLSVLTQELKQKLKWLEVKTLVLSSQVSNKISGLSVSDLPVAV